MTSRSIQPIDFTTRDEVSIKTDLVRRKPFLTPEWTDDNDSDLGMATLDEICTALSVLHFYIDKAAGEGFVETCLKRESLQKLFFFWNIPAASPATVTLTFSLDTGQKVDVVIPAGTQCQTISDVSPVFFETDLVATLKYELLTANTNGTNIVSCTSTGYVAGQLVEIGSDIMTPIQRTIQSVAIGQIVLTTVVPSGYNMVDNAYVSALTIEVDATEGKTVEEVLTNSDGSEFQKKRSVSKLIIDNTLVLAVDEGGGFVNWTPKTTFYESTALDIHFIWRRKWDDTVEIRTGDGVQGKIPLVGSGMKLLFREGGGTRGRVGKNTITQVNDQILVGGSPITIMVDNPAASSGGDDRMDLLVAKIRGPEILKTNDRYISQADFVAGAKSVSGVGNAAAVRITEPGVTYNVGIYIIPSGGGLPSTALKNAVEAELISKCDIRVVPEVFDPGMARIAIGGAVTVLSNYIQEQVKAAVEEALADFFAVTNQEFGRAIRESDISRVIDEVEGVDFVDISMLTLYPRTADIILTRWSGDATISDVTIGITVVEEDWIITLTSATTFAVRGTVSGVQIATGTLGVQYISDNNQVKFTITAGVVPMVSGDNATFRTSNYRDNVDVLPREIPVLDTNSLTYVGGG